MKNPNETFCEFFSFGFLFTSVVSAASINNMAPYSITNSGGMVYLRSSTSPRQTCSVLVRMLVDRIFETKLESSFVFSFLKKITFWIKIRKLNKCFVSICVVFYAKRNWNITFLSCNVCYRSTLKLQLCFYRHWMNWAMIAMYCEPRNTKNFRMATSFTSTISLCGN